MSTRDSLKRLVQEQRVVHVPPVFKGMASSRHIYLEARLYDRMMDALDGNSESDKALARLYASLDSFTSGNFISVGDHPFCKDNSAFMARTDPPIEGIFDIRVHGVRGVPSTRLLGAFCETDVFLGLKWQLRRDLGSRSERLFHNAIMQTIGAWDKLMPKCPRLYSPNLHDHISENFHVV